MAGISSQAAGKLENKLKYKGEELQHVVTMTTETFTVAHFNSAGTGTKTIEGGKTTNVNGTYRATNIGTGQLNSFQNPVYSGMTWYSLPAKKN